MLKLLGVFLMFVSAYCLEQGGLDLRLVQAFFIGLFIYFSEAFFAQSFFEKTVKAPGAYWKRS